MISDCSSADRLFSLSFAPIMRSRVVDVSILCIRFQWNKTQIGCIIYTIDLRIQIETGYLFSYIFPSKLCERLNELDDHVLHIGNKFFFQLLIIVFVSTTSPDSSSRSHARCHSPTQCHSTLLCAANWMVFAQFLAFPAFQCVEQELFPASMFMLKPSQATSLCNFCYQSGFLWYVWSYFIILDHIHQLIHVPKFQLHMPKQVTVSLWKYPQIEVVLGNHIKLYLLVSTFLLVLIWFTEKFYPTSSCNCKSSFYGAHFSPPLTNAPPSPSVPLMI